MRHLILSLLLVPLLGGCALSRERYEPADLVAPGKSIQRLVSLGWKISPPLTSEQVKDLDPVKDVATNNPDAVWAWYQSRARPGDELRHVQNNAGMGFAIFHDGKFVDMTLPVVF
jgi:hypothetical protein